MATVYHNNERYQALVKRCADLERKVRRQQTMIRAQKEKIDEYRRNEVKRTRLESDEDC
jgi:hypothetical protein